MIKTWVGGRRIAFIPVWNQNVDDPPASDWVNKVRSRVFFDPDPTTGVDRSLQRYIQTVSSGIAYIEGFVFQPVASADDDTVGAGLQSLPLFHGYTHALIILPHSTGQHRNPWAWWHASPVNGIPNFARVAMFDDTSFGQQQNIGVWAMETLHIVTHFGDLYNVSPNLGKFDVMACGCETHPSAHTKSNMGWLDNNAVWAHPLGENSAYTLHAISLPQPQPYWRATAIRIKSKNSSGHFMVEARIGTDYYEGNCYFSDGIPSEGVIVYEVQGDTEVYLRTPDALKVGELFEDSAEGLSVKVVGTELGGFAIQIKSKGDNRCTQLAKKIKSLRTMIEIEEDFISKKQLISSLVKAQNEFRGMNCLVLDSPPTHFSLFEPL